MLKGDSINDYDIYFSNYDTCAAVANYYVKKFVENNNLTDIPVVKTFHSKEYQPDLVDDCEKRRVKIFIPSQGIVKNAEYGDLLSEDDTDADLEEVRNSNRVAKALRDKEHRKDKHKGLYKPVFITDNAISLTDRTQLVMRFYGEPKDIHQYFDFVHTTSYYTSGNDTLHLDPKAMESMLTNDLKYIGSKYPLCSIFRMKKFTNRGWMCSASEIVKMVFQLNDLDLKNMEVLREQLIGVDTSYMSSLIGKIEGIEDLSTITTDYLLDLVDEVFGEEQELG